MKRNTFHSVGQHPQTAGDNPYASTTRPIRNKKKNRPVKQLGYPGKGPQPLPPSQMMFLDGIYNNTELRRPPSRGGEFAEKTREEVMMEKKREVKMAQQDALYAMRNKKSGQRPPCRQKEPNALLEIDELFSFKAGGYMEEEMPDQIHNFNQIHGHRGPEPQMFNFHHKKNNTQDVSNLVTLPIQYGERPPSRHKTPPKALGLDLPAFGEQHEELISGKSSVISHTAGHSKVGSFYSPSEETSEIIQLHGNGAILFSDSSHVDESGAMEQNEDIMESERHEGRIRSQTLDGSEKRGGLNKSLNNTTTGLKPLGGGVQKDEFERSKMVMNSTDKLEKEVMPSPLSKLGQLKQRPNKRLQSANERGTGLFREPDSFMVKRDNFLRGTGGGTKLSPSEKAKPLPLKPLIGFQEDSPPFPSSSQLEKYKRAVLASPNERQGTTFSHGFSLTSAASAGKGNFRKGGNAKSGELFKIIRQKHTPLNGKDGGNNSAVVKGSSNGLKFESNLESDFLNLFHQD